jgi:uncharacterized protein
MDFNFINSCFDIVTSFFSTYWEIVLILATTGICAGFLAGLLGVGGGIIFVPVLYFVFWKVLSMAPQDAIILATGSSLATMIPTSCSSCISHFRKGNVDIKLIQKWFVFLLIGVASGIYLSSNFGGLWLTILFGTILMFAAFNMLFFAKAKPIFDELPKMPYQAIMPFSISCISVMLGIGGGTLTVPTLSCFNYDTRKAVGTAATLGLMICLPGAVTTLISDLYNNTNIVNHPPMTIGHICFLAVLLIIPFSILMAPIGVIVNKKIPPHVVKRIFACLMIATSIKMLMSGFGL